MGNQTFGRQEFCAVCYFLIVRGGKNLLL